MFGQPVTCSATEGKPGNTSKCDIKRFNFLAIGALARDRWLHWVSCLSNLFRRHFTTFPFKLNFLGFAISSSWKSYPILRLLFVFETLPLPLQKAWRLMLHYARSRLILRCQMSHPVFQWHPGWPQFSVGIFHWQCSRFMRLSGIHGFTKGSGRLWTSQMPLRFQE